MDSNKAAIQCLVACSDTFKQVEKAQKEAMAQIFTKHATSLNKMGVLELIKAYASKDGLAGIKAMNKILLDPKMPELLLAMLKDLHAFYKQNAKHINKLMKCYKAKCTPEALEMTKELTKLLVNTMNLMTDEKVKAEIAKINETIKKNVKQALKTIT